jgi:hypothetical protein
MGWDNERYPRTKNDTLHLSFIHSFGISHSRFSDFGIPFLIPENSKESYLHGISQGYPWDIQHLVIYLAYP